MIEGVDQLLYHEAYLLDSGLYKDWLGLLSPDIRYWAPVRANVSRQQEDESPGFPLFDENKASLSLRVSRLETGLAWVEVPATRSRRFISNIVAKDGGDGTVHVRSNFIVFRSRSSAEEWMLVGCREDRWTRSEKWMLLERMIRFDQRALENISLFI